ncbi:MAG: CHAT domain-containing protein [bacterium]|nr:CHAT domain-containing protein [bacterium]
MRQLPVAAAIGDTLHEGFMHKGLAYIRLLDGRTREALAGFARAEPLLRAGRNSFGEIDAITGQGRAWEQLGELDRARATYERVARLARENKRPQNEADALNNLGNLEFVRGDPAAGLRAFRATRALRQRLGNAYDIVLPACNEARALAELGRVTEAGATLDSMAVLCRVEGFATLLGHVLNDTAELRLRQGRPADALRVCREVLAMTSGQPVERTRAYRLAPGRWRRTATPLRWHCWKVRLRACASLSPDWALRHDEELVTRLLDGGRAAEAVVLALAAADDARALQRTRDTIAMLVMAARCAMALGDTLAALPHLELASRTWEEARVLPLDLEWRERRSGTQALSEALILARLAAVGKPVDAVSRVEAAFDAAQRFKARTLAERARLNAPVDTVGIVTASRLRREVLREGEVLLDIHVGREVSHAFLLGREKSTCACPAGPPWRRAWSCCATCWRAAPDGRPTRPRCRSGGRGRATCWALAAPRPRRVSSARTARSTWCGGRAAVIPARSIGKAEAWPDVARVPSADLLARTRGRAPHPARGERARGAIVVADANDAGEPLPGAREEAARLARRYRGLSVWQAPPDSAESGLATSLAAFDLLHFASHAALDDQRPWRSGLVARPPRRWLRRRPRGHRDAQLVVLAACASAGGEVLAGEGLQGLSSAFLAAGVPALVATLWPVDDLATARLMERFCDRLAGDPRDRRCGRHARNPRGRAGARGLVRVRVIGDPIVGSPWLRGRVPPVVPALLSQWCWAWSRWLFVAGPPRAMAGIQASS